MAGSEIQSSLDTAIELTEKESLLQEWEQLVKVREKEGYSIIIMTIFIIILKKW